MEDSQADTVSVLNKIASTLLSIDKRLERQEDALQVIRASHDRSRQGHEWPKIDPYEELILLEATTIPLPFVGNWEFVSRKIDYSSGWGPKVFTYDEARGSAVAKGHINHDHGEGIYELTDSDRNLIGQIWDVPYDGRLPWTFSKPVLTRLPVIEARCSIQSLARYLETIHVASMIITDHSLSGGLCVSYKWRKGRLLHDFFETPESSLAAERERTLDIDAELVVHEGHFSAKWCRHIMCTGLPQEMKGLLITSRGISLPSKLFAENDFSFQSVYHSLDIPKSSCVFNMTFYQGNLISKISPRKDTRSILAVTNRYGSLLTDDGPWTILEFYSDPKYKTSIVYSFNSTHVIFHTLARWITTAATNWEYLTTALENHLGVNSTPNESDQDLFEDSNFSKSRRYFRAIKDLSKYIRVIEGNVRAWQGFRDEWLEMYRVDDMDVPVSLRNEISGIEVQCTKLSLSCQLQKTMLAEVILRRDGLFNASAVIESRQAGLLSQDVRLLTYVTIFFLPLAFSTSLWSINDTYSRLPLVWFAIAIAFTTYIVTFNLNWLASSFAKLYHTIRAPILKSMCKDKAKAWKIRGKGLTGFQPKREPKPSEWFVPLYTVRMVRLQIEAPLGRYLWNNRWRIGSRRVNASPMTRKILDFLIRRFNLSFFPGQIYHNEEVWNEEEASTGY